MFYSGIFKNPLEWIFLASQCCDLTYAGACSKTLNQVTISNVAICCYLMRRKNQRKAQWPALGNLAYLFLSLFALFFSVLRNEN
jgi:hypothetical protein